MLGEFLEFSLTTADMLASMDFYRKLGFREASAGASWKHPYTVLTDGRIHIGLHKREPLAPALSFVLPELRKRLETFEALGIEFAYTSIELHRFNHAGFEDPDGTLVTLLEARTFSPLHGSEARASLCGYFLEYRIPVYDPEASARFWEALGLIVIPAEDGGYPQASWGGINLGLQRAGRNARPTLVFANPDLGETAALLEMRGLPLQKDKEGLRLAAPEGVNLLLLPEAT
ncbi:MAG TPA: hypothetical protein VFK21_04500 [Gammaproteobacteria bacterium]|nr:hypothetical protein [Gammaproteobacteria bacterium]